MSVAPKRRYFRFSLRTMLVVFTVVAVWLGWNVHVVQQRKAVVKSLSLADSPGMVLPPNVAVNWVSRSEITSYLPDGVSSVPFTQYQPTAPPRVSALRRWLGDEAQWLVVCKPDSDEDRIRELFPEALVVVPALEGE